MPLQHSLICQICLFSQNHMTQLHSNTYNYIHQTVMSKHEKRLFNRYDQYEVNSIFTQTAEEHLSKKLKGSWRRFIFKAILGILLFFNGYLSHWGPWTWPGNYYFIAFTVVFYHVASYIYGVVSGVSATEGSFVGDYFFGNELKSIAVRMDEDKTTFFLETLKNKQAQPTVKIPYTEYFTTDGYFLQEKFKKLLDQYIESLQKNEKKQK